MLSYLREPLTRGRVKSAYATERQSWSPRADVEAALFFRGVIVAAMGNIETRMGEIAVRASRLPEYQNIRSDFPHQASKRASFLLTVFASGPLSVYQATADRFINRYRSFDEGRNLIAHARMKVVPDWGVHLYDLRKQPKGAIANRCIRMTLEQLEHNAWCAARLSRLGETLIIRLNSTGILPPLSTEE